MSLKHYSPKTPVVLRNGTESLDPRQRFGYISFKADYEPLVPDPKHTITLSDTGVLSEVSKNLFSALHDMDARDLDFILVDSCHEEGLGIAIMDRLRRAIQN